MTFFYWGILILTLYGDLLKRYLSPSESIAILYATALILLVFVLLTAKKVRSLKPSRSSRTILKCLFFVVIIYVVQLIFSLFRGITFAAVSNALYVCIPVLYALIIIKYFPQLDLTKMANLFQVLIIPINIVGMIQYAHDNTFFISTTYTSSGGIIERNLFEVGSTFLRLPSIYVSADRYSAIGLTQCFFALVMWTIPSKERKTRPLWPLFNFISGIMALMIAGARSRILILLVTCALFVFSAVLRFNRRSNSRILKQSMPSVLIGLFFLLPIFTFLLIANPAWFRHVADFPVVNFVIRSLHEGDVGNRIDESLQHSLIPENISLFGEGLGFLGNKPGEFGIMSMWIEGGLIFGCLTLISFISIILVSVNTAFRAYLGGEPSKVILFAYPAIVLTFGILTGLTGVLELSSGILLMVSLGSIARYSNQSLYRVEAPKK